MRTGERLGAVGNYQNILVFSHNTVIIKVNPTMEVTLYKVKSI